MVSVDGELCVSWHGEDGADGFLYYGFTALVFSSADDDGGDEFPEVVDVAYSG